MRLKWLKDDGTNPEATRYYALQPSNRNLTQEEQAKRKDRVGIVQALSLRPDVAYHFMSAVKRGHFDTTGYLSQETKQMVATYTSALRSCVY